MNIRRTIILSLIVSAFAGAALSGVNAKETKDPEVSQGPGTPARGPLSIHRLNPRYFDDGTGKAVYLTGSHTHHSLQDEDDIFNFGQYLDFIVARGHNFIRLWCWEDTTFTPLPYLRTGPGTAVDDKPKFDLNKLNPEYFERLRERVMAARERGIYVSVMLFQGWSVERKTPNRDIWYKHPFHRDNNVNGIDGDEGQDSEGTETHALLNDRVTSIQEAYVRKVIDTVNDLDNVLYEITNEDLASPENIAWQYHMIDVIHGYEATKLKQHPVGMTAQLYGTNDTLLNSPADWISPVNEKSLYQDDPPQSRGKKVILSDTDHLWGNGGSAEWVWKSFTRGLNPIFMDLTPPLSTLFSLPEADAIRIAMGWVRAYAMRLNLSAMAPNSQVCSTTYCLVNPGKEYVVYLPARRRHSLPVLGRFLRTVTVDLSPVAEPLVAEWFNPSTGETLSGGTTTSRVATKFTPPFSPAVLHLKVQNS
jgi:hypothetical protein